MRFLLRWQHVAPETQMEGRRGLLAVIEQLQGFEVAAGSWEEAVLPARVAGYRPEWLDDLCLSGEVAWGRFTARAANGAGDAPGEETGGRGGAVPSRATPVTFALRDNLDWLLRAARGPARPAPPGDGAARDILEALRTRGALFYNDLAAVTGRLRVEVEEGLWDLVSRGLVTADGFGSVRALLDRPRALGQARGASARRAASPRCPRDRGGRGGPLVDLHVAGAARRRGRRRRRDARRGGRRAASRALRRRLPRSRDAREPRGAVARDLMGAPPHGGARHRARRPLRHRLRRRAVRAARRRRGAAPDSAPRAVGRDRAPRRRRPAEPDGSHHSGPSRPRRARQRRHLPRRPPHRSIHDAGRRCSVSARSAERARDRRRLAGNEREVGGGQGKGAR